MTGCVRKAVLLLLLAMSSSIAAAEREGPDRVLLKGAGGVAYVENETCKSCHTKIFDKWRFSDHARAMEPVSEDTVLGDFTDVVFEDDGAPARFFKKDGQFFIETEGPDGEQGVFEAKYTFGHRPLQQYLLALPDGRLQAFDIAWDVEAKRWFRILNAAHPLGHPLHWTGRLQNWNNRCAECHSTDLRKNYRPATRSYETTFAEPNVSCQSCHGPGAAHLAWAENRAAAPDGSRGLVVDLRNQTLTDKSLDISTDVCGRCHSRHFRLVQQDDVDQRFFDQFGLALIGPGLYHPDGQIDDEVFVLGSFLQSKMHRAGVTCLDCHNPHDGAVLADGDALCVSCHNAAPPDRFPTLNARFYDSPEHHHHPEGGPGSQCVDCHMPTKTYMQIDPRRDHSFRVPRPDLSASAAAPDACTGCHTEKSPEWAAGRIDAWSGEEWRARRHFGPSFAAARRGDASVFQELRDFLSDRDQGAIARASAAELLANFGAAAAPSLREAFADESPIVRASVAAALTRDREPATIAALTERLDDPSRWVRIVAARALAAAPRSAIPAERHAALDVALADYIAAQRGVADTPEGQLNLAGLYLDLGRWEEARAAFREAIQIAPDHAPGHLQWATVLSVRGEKETAAEVLEGGIAHLPQNADLPYALGLLRIEQTRLEEAENALALAITNAPTHTGALYAHGVVLLRKGRALEAEASLRRADAADPNSAQAAQLLIRSQARRGALSEAVRDAEELAARFPQSVEIRRLLATVRQMRAR